MLDRDELILHPLRFGERGFEDLVQLGTDCLLATADLGKDSQPFLGGFEDLSGVNAQLFE